MMTTNEEYAGKSGTVCPYCQYEEVSYLGQPFELDGFILWLTECDDCGKKWRSQYSLTGWEETGWEEDN